MADDHATQEREIIRGVQDAPSKTVDLSRPSQYPAVQDVRGSNGTADLHQAPVAEHPNGLGDTAQTNQTATTGKMDERDGSVRPPPRPMTEEADGPIDTTQNPQSPVGANSGTSSSSSSSTSNNSRKQSDLLHPKSLKDHIMSKGPPGGYDSKPLPDAPRGFTIKFTFRSAHNLPPADLSTASSDPFIMATLKASNPKRHHEEPHLTHRTPTIRRTTEPEWMDEWVVANVPPSGFTLKCRMYDEDSPDRDDRLGNVTVKVHNVFEGWKGIPAPGKDFDARKRAISRRAYVLKGITSLLSSNRKMTPILCLSMELLGPSEPPHAQMHTVGPTRFIKHYSPMIGRLAGTKVDAIQRDGQERSCELEKGKAQKYDFQANEMQLSGPVPWRLYHRYVEFKPVIGSMFSSTGVRGKILNKALHKQHRRIYNFNRTTEIGTFHPGTQDASRLFLKLANFDKGGRVFTYVLTLDGLFRFTETGKEFGVDLLSKHTMHSDVQTYIAFSGEFFIRRLQYADASEDPNPDEKTHPAQDLAGGPPNKDPPQNPAHYQLIIDNDSGTYRPDKSLLPELKAYLSSNFPGLGIVAMHWEDKELNELKDVQQSAKKQEGNVVHGVLNRSMSSFSSAESELSDRDDVWEQGQKTKREAAFEAVEDPKKIKEAIGAAMPKGSHGETSQS